MYTYYKYIWRMFIYIDRYCRYIQYWYKSLEQSWKAIRINFTFGGLCVELLQRQKIRAAGANETLMKVGHGGGGQSLMLRESWNVSDLCTTNISRFEHVRPKRIWQGWDMRSNHHSWVNLIEMEWRPIVRGLVHVFVSKDVVNRFRRATMHDFNMNHNLA